MVRREINYLISVRGYANDKFSLVREVAEESVGESGDASDLKLLEKMLGDLALVNAGLKNAPKQIFPVREAAQKAINEIKKRME
jgi:hypothetical protein